MSDRIQAGEDKYDHESIEKKWQKRWAKQPEASRDFSDQPKKYILIEFPYPSGDGLHVGHIRSYATLDAVARYSRLKGDNVLYPIGWDAFGLPTENYAIKTGVHPREATDKNIANFRRQMKSLGLSFDWSREVDTSDPKYYKWTQWIFLQLLKKGLAYQDTIPINWCPSCKIGLANEEVIDGKCERCGTEVTRKMQKQWMLKITAYADRLLKDLDTVDYLEKIKTQQINWIGRSEGANIWFNVKAGDVKSQNKPVAVIVHGSPSKPKYPPQQNKHWFPNIKKELEGQGYQVITPELPQANKPIYADWVKEFEKSLGDLTLDQRSVVIGHSAGCSFVTRYLSEKGISVNSIVLVAPSKLLPPDDKELHERLDDLYTFSPKKGIAHRMLVIYSTDDRDRIVESSQYFIDFYNADSRQYKDKGHFTDRSGVTELPEAVDWIKKGSAIKVFTTRLDTLFGATYIVLAPEHELIINNQSSISNFKEVEAYIKKSAKKSDLERTDLAKDKTGVELKGIKAINPASGEEIPIWVADYVLSSYGTGAIMAVPAHDQRDFEFAKKYKLPIRQVIAPYFTENPGGKDMVRTDKKTVKRKTAYAFLYSKDKKAFLCLNWEKFGWHSGIIGGVDEGESYRESTIREIREETGYRNIKFIKYLGAEQHNHFYAAHKDENRYAAGQGMLFELLDEEKESVSGEHTANHKAAWIEADKMDKWLNIKSFIYMWEAYKTGADCYTGEGTVINSPVKNEETKPRVIMIHGSSGRDKSKEEGYVEPNRRHWHGWLEDELNKQGYDVVNPIMPTDWAPDYWEWKKVFEKFKVTENDILIGTSAGGTFIIRWLGETGQKVRQVVLNAPGYYLEKKGEERMKEFCDFEVTSDVNKQIGKLTVFVSNDRPARIKSAEMYAEKLNGKLVRLKERGHFCVWDNPINNKFPELLQEIVGLDTPSFNYLSSDQAGKKITQWLEKRHLGKPAVNYKLRDWIFSRQHYWGEPIPIVHCPDHGAVPVPEKDLPVELPHVKKYQPTDTGESPLANVKNWVNTKCPQCGKPAKRETDTMPNWAGSSWYYIRYADPHNDKEFASRKKLDYWLPVNIYNGGMEHTTLHLLYSRFWYKFLFDQGLVPEPEPYKRRHSHGIVLAEDGRKMSKSFGNVVNPDDYVHEYGADSVRMYEMFIGPFEDMIPWSTRGLVGVRRFLDRVEKVVSVIIANKKDIIDVSGESKLIHKTVKKVTEDIEKFRFNTAVSALMEYFNTRDFAPKINKQNLLEGKEVDLEAMQKFLVLLFPFAPHLSSELWEQSSFKGDIREQPWPKYSEEALIQTKFNLVVQVNGKVRATIEVEPGLSEEKATELALKQPNIKKHVQTAPKKVIYLKDKIINLVV
ncbi:MAG: alpha/beta fold hydrolase [bacterium]